MPPRRPRGAMTPRQFDDPRAQAEAARAPVGRAERRPFGGPRGKLDIPVDMQDPNFVYRWVKDDLGRIEDAREAGYELVMDPRMASSPQQSDGSDMGAAISRLAGKDDNGRAQRLYLLKTPRDIYEENQKIKMAEVDAIDDEIRRGDNLRQGGMAGQANGITLDTAKIERG